LIGDSVLLVPEHMVAVSTDAARARAVIRQIIAPYLQLANYVNNWKRLGFCDSDLAPPRSDRLIDSLVAHGSTEDMAKRLNDHLQAGADHVAILALAEPDTLLPTLTQLAGPLGLQPRT
jgi:probable F420-dependent oxidoreductase